MADGVLVVGVEFSWGAEFEGARMRVQIPPKSRRWWIVGRRWTLVVCEFGRKGEDGAGKEVIGPGCRRGACKAGDGLSG